MSGYFCRTGCGWRGEWWTFGWHFCRGARTYWMAPPELVS